MVTRLVPSLAVFGVLAVFAARPATNSRPAREAPAASAAIDAAIDSLEVALTAIERQSWVAWQAHDGKFFQNFLSDDHVEVGTNGIASKADVVAYVGSGACVVTTYSVDHFRATRFDENTALLTYRAEQETMCGKEKVPSPTWVSSLFVRRSGRWVNVLYQHTLEQR
jgi:Domain of unknown function (DUF4440)